VVQCLESRTLPLPVNKIIEIGNFEFGIFSGQVTKKEFISDSSVYLLLRNRSISKVITMVISMRVLE